MGLVAGGAVGPMVVVVDVPGRDRVAALGFAEPGPGVEQLVGQDALVSLDLAVVPWRVGPGPLVPGGEGADRAGEVLGAVAGAVVGHDPGEPGDPVGGEPDPGTEQEPDRGLRGLVFEGLGVGQPGEPIHGGVEVDVAGSGATHLGLRGGPGCGAGLIGIDAVDTPAAAIRDTADLLHIDMDHVPGPVRGDGAGPAQRFPVDIEVVEAMQAEFVQPPGHGRDRDGYALGRELTHDPPC